MGLFGNDKAAKERIQEGKRKIRRAEEKAHSEGKELCHSCAEKTATTRKHGDPLCSSCAS